jgi:ATP-dependent Clp protease ATP-binding subunit ClpA
MAGDVIDLAGRAVEPDDPEASLAAVAALRGSLEELEAHHVSQAIGSGCSWSRIGALLGISKQAAHRRHARRLRRAKPRRRHQLIVTVAARQAVHLGRLEASERGARRAGTEDLLLGVIRLGERPTGATFDSLNVTLSAAREQVAEFFGYEAPEYLELGWRRLPLSRRARAALEQAMREVVRRADRRLDAEHVLLALLRDEQAGAVRTLAGLGTSPETVQRVLEAALERRDERREVVLDPGGDDVDAEATDGAGPSPPAS